MVRGIATVDSSRVPKLNLPRKRARPMFGWMMLLILLLLTVAVPVAVAAPVKAKARRR